jgi:hypothetical protein
VIPLEALPNYLDTREALFVEKYEGVRLFTENDRFALLEAQSDQGRPFLATVNEDLLKWDKKASHPWMFVVSIGYDGSANSGLPNSADLDELDSIEQAISMQLKDVEGYLNIGRQSANDRRDIFYACADFREPAKVAFATLGKVSRPFEYSIFKDKYWQTVSHLIAAAP